MAIEVHTKKKIFKFHEATSCKESAGHLYVTKPAGVGAQVMAMFAAGNWSYAYEIGSADIEDTSDPNQSSDPHPRGYVNLDPSEV
ncbi:hypothetical protein [Amycolatopsis sp. NPDC049868]|uniref:hypothetical protein n=1 Tax=Amycolatopsis sp. NPDC049868 TaxID=3363934 RepID=UPI0037A793EE